MEIRGYYVDLLLCSHKKMDLTELFCIGLECTVLIWEGFSQDQAFDTDTRSPDVVDPLLPLGRPEPTLEAPCIATTLFANLNLLIFSVVA